MVVQGPSTVRSSVLRGAAFRFAKSISTGLRSGPRGGRKASRGALASTIVLTEDHGSDHAVETEARDERRNLPVAAGEAHGRSRRRERPQL